MFFSWERSQKPYFYIGVNLMKIGITKNGTLVEARKADRNEKYFCPSCQRALKLCSGQYKKNYFAHQCFTKKQGYQPKGETKRHLMGKKKVIDFFNQRQISVQTEFYLPEIKQRADLRVEIDDHIYLVEYQCSPIKLKEIQKRAKAYLKLGLISYWIAGPKHLGKGSLFRTVQKFGRFSKKEGWWILAWDALKQEAPHVFFNMQRAVLGKVLYQERIFNCKGHQNEFIRPKLPTVEYEAYKIEHSLLGNQIDQRYVEIQQLCYTNGKNLMGCPWTVHFPRLCTDFRNRGIPLLNRVRFLVLAEQKVKVSITDITQIDIEFWQMLLEKNIVISNDGEWYFISQKVQWYNSLSEKLAKKIKVG